MKLYLRLLILGPNYTVHFPDGQPKYFLSVAQACCFHVICSEDAEHSPMMLFYDGVVLATHACLPSMFSPFSKYCEQEAFPHQLHIDAYFSEVLFFTFLWWIVYFIFDRFPSMSIFCLCSSSAFHAYSPCEFVPPGNLITVFSAMPSRSLKTAVHRPQSQRTPLDISFQTDAESVISTLKGFVSTPTLDISFRWLRWVRVSGDCPTMCPITPAPTVWEGGSWGNLFLFARGEATSSSTLAVKLHNFFSYVALYPIIGKIKHQNLNKYFFDALLLTSWCGLLCIFFLVSL